MTEYALSKRADSDLVQIARTSLAQWGPVQAERYIGGLHELFLRLAEFPNLGRNAGDIRSGYLRIESAAHIVFYKQTVDGILIVRVLHERMDFSRHL
ncbi:MAG: type II toxin-antitoxin system RelE/ParE family toxin [Azospirillaceae bacterium]|nr:type II toxin-antitoxin system RelE/ParE family toxin [Azospirillaceae bacterium]